MARESFEMVLNLDVSNVVELTEQIALNGFQPTN